MPDTQPTENPVVAEEPKAEAEQFSEEAKKAIADAKGSLWKKVLYWALGILGSIGALVGILYLFKGKGNGPINGIKNQVKQTKADIAKSDLDAKLAIAESKAKEDETKAKLAEIKEMTNEYEALDELNKLIAPDAPSVTP